MPPDARTGAESSGVYESNASIGHGVIIYASVFSGLEAFLVFIESVDGEFAIWTWLAVWLLVFIADQVKSYYPPEVVHARCAADGHAAQADD